MTMGQLFEPSEECGAAVFKVGKVCFNTTNTALDLSQNQLSCKPEPPHSVVSTASMAQLVQ